MAFAFNEGSLAAIILQTNQACNSLRQLKKVNDFYLDSPPSRDTTRTFCSFSFAQETFVVKLVVFRFTVQNKN